MGSETHPELSESHSDKGLEFLRADLEHVRFITFSLMAMCFILIYLVWASWSDANEVLGELNRLDSGVKSAQRAKTDKHALGVLFPEVGQPLERRWNDRKKLVGLSKTSPSPMINFQRALEDFLDVPVSFEREGLSETLWNGLRVLSSEGAFANTDTPLIDLRNQFEMTRWNIEVLDHFEGDPAPAKGWIRGYADNSSFYTLVTGPTVGSVRLEWPEKAGPGKATISLEMSVALAVHSDPSNPRPPVESRQYTFDWVPRRQALAYSSDRFDRTYSRINAHWKELSPKSVSEAKALMIQKTNESLQKKNIKFFEMEFAGEHIGIIVPCFALALLWYLISYLSNILSYLKQTETTTLARHSFISPWIGAMANNWAQLISIVGLIVLPSLSVWLSLWRLSNHNVIFAFIIGETFAAFGAKCVMLGEDINLALTNRKV
jgi:hypothetical protein